MRPLIILYSFIFYTIFVARMWLRTNLHAFYPTATTQNSTRRLQSYVQSNHILSENGVHSRTFAAVYTVAIGTIEETRNNTNND